MGGNYHRHCARAAAAINFAAGWLWSELNRPHGGTRQARVRDLELTEPRAGDSDRFGSDRPQAFCRACARAAALQVRAPNKYGRPPPVRAPRRALPVHWPRQNSGESGVLVLVSMKYFSLLATCMHLVGSIVVWYDRWDSLNDVLKVFN